MTTSSTATLTLTRTKSAVCRSPSVCPVCSMNRMIIGVSFLNGSAQPRRAKCLRRAALPSEMYGSTMLPLVKSSEASTKLAPSPKPHSSPWSILSYRAYLS
ncbi:hypothetical protein ABW21_db0200842 [Orbilia brochopaga]|nr:hypothetical protein ABW21_db0200842 [Drechslerella brochopaga]